MKNFLKKCMPVFQQDKQLSKVYYINGQEVRPVQQLAQGSYAFVYSLSRDDLVLKHMIIQTREALQEAVSEVNMLYRLRDNQNINKVFNVFVGGNEVNLNTIEQDTRNVSLPVDFDIFLERCQCTLLDYMNNQQNYISENVIWNVAGGILSGLCAIHAIGYSNRDMKAENVLLASSTPNVQTIRLCDLGSASSESFTGENILKNQSLRARLEAEISSKTTPQYRAPELVDLFARLPIGLQQDVFSFGVTIFRLMYKRLPFPEGELLANFNVRYNFPDETEGVNKNSNLQANDQLSSLPKYSPELKELVKRSLVKDPRKRATVFQLREMVQGKIGQVGGPQEPQDFNQQIEQFGAPGLASNPQSQQQHGLQSSSVLQFNNQLKGNPFSNFQISANTNVQQSQQTATQQQVGIMDLLDWNQPSTVQQNMYHSNQVQQISVPKVQQNNDIMKNGLEDEGQKPDNEFKKVVDKVLFISCQNLGSAEYNNNYTRIDKLLELCKTLLTHQSAPEDQQLLNGVHKRIQEMIDYNKHSMDINKGMHLHLLKDIATLFQIAVQYSVITQHVPYNQANGFVLSSKQQFQSIQQACINLINLIYGLTILVNQSQYLQQRYNEIKTIIVQPSIKLVQNCCKKDIQLDQNNIIGLKAEYQNLVGKDVFGIQIGQQLQLQDGVPNIVDDVFGF